MLRLYPSFEMKKRKLSLNCHFKGYLACALAQIERAQSAHLNMKRPVVRTELHIPSEITVQIAKF